MNLNLTKTLVLIYLGVMASSFELTIENDLTTSNLIQPKAYIAQEGVVIATPDVIVKGSTASFILNDEKHPLNAVVQGVVTLPTQQSATTLSIAFSVDITNGAANKIGVYYGSDVTSTSLLANFLSNDPSFNIETAGQGWNQIKYSTMTINYFISSSSKDAIIRVHLLPYVTAGRYMILSGNTSLLLQSTGNFLQLNDYNETQKASFGWNLIPISGTSRFRITSIEDPSSYIYAYAYGYPNNVANFYIDLRSNVEDSHTEWTLEYLSQDTFKLRGDFGGWYLDNTKCRTSNSQPWVNQNTADECALPGKFIGLKTSNNNGGQTIKLMPYKE